MIYRSTAFLFLLHYTVSKYIVVVISQKVLRPPSKLKLVTQKIKSELGEKKKTQENAFIDFCMLKLRERIFSASVTISILFKFNSQCRGMNNRRSSCNSSKRFLFEEKDNHRLFRLNLHYSTAEIILAKNQNQPRVPRAWVSIGGILYFTNKCALE